MNDSFEKQRESLIVHTNRENKYYNVLGSLNYIIKTIESSDDEQLENFKQEVVALREKIEDNLLELKYSDN